MSCLAGCWALVPGCLVLVSAAQLFADAVLYLFFFTYGEPSRLETFPKKSDAPRMEWPDIIQEWAIANENARVSGIVKAFFFSLSREWIGFGLKENSAPYWRDNPTRLAACERILCALHGALWYNGARPGQLEYYIPHSIGSPRAAVEAIDAILGEPSSI